MADTNKKRVLVIGAGGFAGGFHVAESLRRGYETWAGVRASTSRKWLDDKDIHFLELDFENTDDMAARLSSALPEGERWDYIVYNLGATKCLNFSDFNRINYDLLRNFTDALHKADKVPHRMLLMSSLSALGPGDEKGYAPFTETMIPHPNTRYGTSKMKAETWMATAGIPHVILRPTGVYGPRDHDYFLMFESIGKGFDFSVGLRKQLLTFIYVEDLSRAVFDALEKAPEGGVYNLADGHSYTQEEFRRIAAKNVGRKHVIGMKMPLWAVKCVSAVAEKIGIVRGKPSTLNLDKYNILKQRNWNVDISKAQREFGFNPQIDLEEGVRQSVEWYKKEGWL